eukprot:COSAG02_NODE_15923_length_1129_cov_1.502913_1_plen_133_part_01
MGCYVPPQRRSSWPDRPLGDVQQALATVRRQQGIDASDKADILAATFRRVVSAFDTLVHRSTADPFHGLATATQDGVVRYDRVAAKAGVGGSAGILLSGEALDFLACHERFFRLDPRSWVDGSELSSEARDSV